MIANSSFLNIHQLQCRFPLSRGTSFDRRSYNFSSRARAMVGWLPIFQLVESRRLLNSR